MTLDRNAVGLVEASFMSADFAGYDRVSAAIQALPESARYPMRERMVKHAVREQVRVLGKSAVLRQLSDLGTRREGGGDYYARLGKDQTEAALASLSSFVRSLPDG